MTQTIKKENVLLIVDENTTRRSNLATKLRIQGHDTEVSSSGFHLLNMIEQAIKFDNKTFRGLVIVGNSEDMPAREIILLVRNIFQSKVVFPILCVGGSEDPEEIVEIIKEGANEFVINISDQVKIIEKINKYFPIQR